MENKTERLTLTVEEAGQQLGISRGLMYEAIRRNEIPNIRIGRRILIPSAALANLLGGAAIQPNDSSTTGGM